MFAAAEEPADVSAAAEIYGRVFQLQGMTMVFPAGSPLYGGAVPLPELVAVGLQVRTAFTGWQPGLSHGEIDASIAEVIVKIWRRWVCINNGLDFNGLPTHFVPIWSFSYLQEVARHFAQQAIQTERVHRFPGEVRRRQAHQDAASRRNPGRSQGRGGGGFPDRRRGSELDTYLGTRMGYANDGQLTGGCFFSPSGLPVGLSWPDLLLVWRLSNPAHLYLFQVREPPTLWLQGLTAVSRRPRHALGRDGLGLDGLSHVRHRASHQRRDEQTAIRADEQRPPCLGCRSCFMVRAESWPKHGTTQPP